jgi:hypothetical protein
MSTVKTQRTQYGISTNPSNNFVVDASQADGTLKISRGNVGATTQEILTIPTEDGTRIGKYLVRGPKSTTSGTSVEFSSADSTGIPSWARKLTLVFDGVSTNGVNVLMVQLGTASGWVTTGYMSTVGQTSSATAAAIQLTTGIGLSGNNSAADLRYGHMLLTTITNNRWIASSVSPLGNVASIGYGGGQIVMPSTVDRLRITTFGQTDAFDAGSVSLVIEG